MSRYNLFPFTLSFPQLEKGYGAGCKVSTANEPYVILHILWPFLKFPEFLPNGIVWQAQKWSVSALFKSGVGLSGSSLAAPGTVQPGVAGDLLLDRRQWRTNINGITGGIFYISPHGSLWIAIWPMLHPMAPVRSQEGLLTNCLNFPLSPLLH